MAGLESSRAGLEASRAGLEAFRTGLEGWRMNTGQDSRHFLSGVSGRAGHSATRVHEIMLETT